MSKIIKTGMSDEQKARRHKFDPKWVDPDGMTYEEYQAAMNKMWPRMAEPDRKGIDLHPDDPRRRFIATSEGVIFSQASPLTEEDRLESDRFWDSIALARDQSGYRDPQEEEALKKL
ncbi:hypothetical protein ASJ81_10115 [Methanosarcina spelaei]|uniref:Uncharacterized protein n=1 Tax=Methanosarcina spelaei TaxID=1036679 RepID=A0A2A2HPV0_9EURY|nr:hypothetical protein [Methanosarcina spelaei]PAV11477.1 hypothetical protein ASJ81_10115 [Methanosarcina spelaei]